MDSEATFPDGRMVFIGNRFSSKGLSQVLLVDAERNGPDGASNLELESATSRFLSRILGRPDPAPYISSLALGTAGEIWIAGVTNRYTGFVDEDHSDAYLARIDATGRPLWEKTYGNGGLRSIRRIALMKAGDLVVVGGDGWHGDGWVARIAPDGRRIWDRHIARDKGIAATSLTDNRIAVAGFEATGSARTHDYQDDVAAWILDGSGNVLARTRVREAINTYQGSHFGNIAIIAAKDAVYVASSWEGGREDAKPVAVARLGFDGRLVWNTVISDAAPAFAWGQCARTLAVDTGGNALVACAVDNKVRFFELDGSTGALRESRFSLPQCQLGHPARLFLNVNEDGTIILSGTRFAASVGAGCTWMGRLTKLR